jgi:hypothetical protein
VRSRRGVRSGRRLGTRWRRWANTFTLAFAFAFAFALSFALSLSFTLAFTLAFALAFAFAFAFTFTLAFILALALAFPEILGTRVLRNECIADLGGKDAVARIIRSTLRGGHKSSNSAVVFVALFVMILDILRDEKWNTDSNQFGSTRNLTETTSVMTFASLEHVIRTTLNVVGHFHGVCQ